MKLVESCAPFPEGSQQYLVSTFRKHNDCFGLLFLYKHLVPSKTESCGGQKPPPGHIQNDLAQYLT
jgi:hypothetical protein